MKKSFLVSVSIVLPMIVGIVLMAIAIDLEGKKNSSATIAPPISMQLDEKPIEKADPEMERLVLEAQQWAKKHELEEQTKKLLTKELTSGSWLFVKTKDIVITDRNIKHIDIDDPVEMQVVFQESDGKLIMLAGGENCPCDLIFHTEKDDSVSAMLMISLAENLPIYSILPVILTKQDGAEDYRNNRMTLTKKR